MVRAACYLNLSACVYLRGSFSIPCSDLEFGAAFPIFDFQCLLSTASKNETNSNRLLSEEKSIKRLPQVLMVK